MVYVARFATHKEMFVNMPVGMRLPLYCTAAGRAVLSRLDPTWPTGCWSAATVDPIPPPRSPAWTPCWLSWSSRAGTAMHVQWRVLPGRHHRQRRRAGCRRHPLGAVNVSVPSSRWSFEQAQAVFGPQVVETAHAISVSRTLGRSYPFYELEPPGGAARHADIRGRRSLISVRRTAGPRRREALRAAPALRIPYYFDQVFGPRLRKLPIGAATLRVNLIST